MTNTQHPELRRLVDALIASNTKTTQLAKRGDKTYDEAIVVEIEAFDALRAFVHSGASAADRSPITIAARAFVDADLLSAQLDALDQLRALVAKESQPA